MACGKKGCAKPLTEDQKKVLEALAAKEEPLACKEIAADTGLTSNQVSCRIRSLKSKGFVESPVRCKYVITEEGKKELAN